ncbi:dolichyl-phosphate beta-glucosyltransferase [Microbacterium aquimaris]|uniref:dolichyl-phosphate beta-glucosyltransferase n=1 Tax=Microbacterium aquimaris TaxID=459816 RepID=A0ABU5N305_9MICO|nr:dolichyl-phosphate beta-glucosyltransferase [Microbacterium aquimaris]MDZ8160432.1 glycosyltransferase family 2 protein [Microbacterium aquimaris]
MTEPLDRYHAYKAWVNTPIEGVPEVSVVIPAYNEEIRILPTIGAIATHMSASGRPWELIVADDGSTDDTVRLVGDLGFANLRVLVAERNGGKGSAVRRGMLAARGDLVLFADADQSTPIEQFEMLEAKTAEGFDVVVGSRKAEGAEVRHKSRLRRVLSWGLHTLVRIVFGITVLDTQCGFKLFTRDAAQELFTTQRVDGFSFDLEVLYLAGKRHLRVAEVPVEWIDAPGSTVSAIAVSLLFLRDLVAIKWRDLRGQYATPRRHPDKEEGR